MMDCLFGVRDTVTRCVFCAGLGVDVGTLLHATVTHCVFCAGLGVDVGIVVVAGGVSGAELGGFFDVNATAGDVTTHETQVTYGN